MRELKPVKLLQLKGRKRLFEHVFKRVFKFMPSASCVVLSRNSVRACSVLFLSSHFFILTTVFAQIGGWFWTPLCGLPDKSIQMDQPSALAESSARWLLLAVGVITARNPPSGLCLGVTPQPDCFWGRIKSSATLDRTTPYIMFKRHSAAQLWTNPPERSWESWIN